VAHRPRWMLYAVAGVVVIGGLAVMQRVLDKAGSEAKVERALRAEGVQVLSSGRGQRGALTLRDGTRAALGSDSHLRIPKEFGTTLRTIELDGTATFTVTPSSAAQLPFAVRAGASTIVATGTVFTVRRFVEDEGVVVQVTEGSVDITDRATGATRAVKAGESVRQVNGTVTVLDETARDVALAWTRDSLVFVQAPLKTVVPELVRWFGMNAVLGDPAIGDRPVSLRLALSSSGDAIKSLTSTANLTIAFGNKDRLEFSGAPEPKARVVRKPQ
jgi:transmembrane sensor